MSFTPRLWKDLPDKTTPLDAANLIDLETRVTSYADASIAPVLNAVELLQSVAINVKSSPYSASGDGTIDDTAAIQAAIDAANTAGGGVVLLPKGTYLVSALTLRNNVWLCGSGRDVTTIKTSGPAASGSSVLNGNGRTGVIITDLTLDGDNQTNAAVGIYINGSNTTKLTQVLRCRITHFTSTIGQGPFGSSAQGIYCWTADKVTIADTDFVDNLVDILMDQPGRDCQVINNVIRASSVSFTSRQYGIVFRKATTAESGALIQGNTIRDIQSDPSGVGTQGFGIQLNNVQGVRVIGNSCDNCNTGGIHVGSGSYGALVIGNTMTNGITNTGIYCEVNFGSTTLPTDGTDVGCILMGNRIRTAGGYGISLSYSPGTIVLANRVSECQREGIFCDSDEVTIERNHIYNCQLGDLTPNPSSTPNVQAMIRVTTGHRCSIVGNYVYTTHTTTPSDYAIAVSDNGHTVRDNILTTGFVTAGLYQAASMTNKVSGNEPRMSSISAVASAAAVTLPIEQDVVSVTGTTGITSIAAASQAGRRVTLIFAGVLTVTDGGNLKLASNFTSAANATLTLVCDGTNWYETNRTTT